MIWPPCEKVKEYPTGPKFSLLVALIILRTANSKTQIVADSVLIFACAKV